MNFQSLLDEIELAETELLLKQLIVPICCDDSLSCDGPSTLVSLDLPLVESLDFTLVKSLDSTHVDDSKSFDEPPLLAHVDALMVHSLDQTESNSTRKIAHSLAIEFDSVIALDSPSLHLAVLQDVEIHSPAKSMASLDSIESTYETLEMVDIVHGYFAVKSVSFVDDAQLTSTASPALTNSHSILKVKTSLIQPDTLPAEPLSEDETSDRSELSEDRNESPELNDDDSSSGTESVDDTESVGFTDDEEEKEEIDLTHDEDLVFDDAASYTSSLDRSYSFQNATVDDYKDVEILLHDINRFMKRSPSRAKLQADSARISSEKVQAELSSKRMSFEKLQAESDSSRIFSRPVSPNQTDTNSLKISSEKAIFSRPVSPNQTDTPKPTLDRSPTELNSQPDAPKPTLDQSPTEMNSQPDTPKATLDRSSDTIPISEIMERTPATSNASPPKKSNHKRYSSDISIEEEQCLDQTKLAIAKLSEANVQKITTRIYIEDASSFKTMVLTSLMTAEQVVQAVVEASHAEKSSDWTLFELCNDLGIERPLRDWEIVTDVLSCWDPSASMNAIIVKRYAYRSTVSPKSLNGKFPRAQGFIYLEASPGKWQKKFCVLKESKLYYYRDANDSSSQTLLCSLANFDVFTLSQKRNKTPTEFCFAVRSMNRSSLFERKEDYFRILCVEKVERLYDWVFALRLAKSERNLVDFPETFEDGRDLNEKALKKVHDLLAQKHSLQNSPQLSEAVPRRTLRHSDESSRKHGMSQAEYEAALRQKERRRLDRENRHRSDDLKLKRHDSSHHSSRRSKSKPLIDISDVNNCRQCGCSEYKSLNAKNTCANCYHVHIQ